MKTFFQTRQYDCGVACIKTILNIYKSNVNIQKIRQISNTTSSGTTIYGMKKCLEYFGFICKAIRTKVPLCKLTLDINLPCIALVTSEKLINHYVVIKKIKSNRIIIIDPKKAQSNILLLNLILYFVIFYC